MAYYGRPRTRHRDICRLCGADIYAPARARHEASFRCYARRGQLVRDGWVRPCRIGGVGSRLYKVWPPEHQRRWPDVVRLSDSLYFRHHSRMYLRSPRPDVHVEALLKAMRAYRARRRVRFADAFAALMAMSADDVRRLALTWSPPAVRRSRWDPPSPWDHWTIHLLSRGEEP